MIKAKLAELEYSNSRILEQNSNLIQENRLLWGEHLKNK